MSTPGERESVEAVVERSMAEVNELCEVMHDAYEAAAAQEGWETQKRSRKPWSDVPEANKATMRVAVAVLLDHLDLAARDAEQRARGGAEAVTQAVADMRQMMDGFPKMGAQTRAGWALNWLRDRAAALDAQAEAGGSDG